MVDFAEHAVALAGGVIATLSAVALTGQSPRALVVVSVVGVAVGRHVYRRASGRSTGARVDTCPNCTRPIRSNRDTAYTLDDHGNLVVTCGECRTPLPMFEDRRRHRRAHESR